MNNNNHSSRFTDGLVLGILIGALAVFLFGTKKGKGILKVISEQGLDGITNMLEEYDLADIEEEEEPVEKPKANGHIAKKAEEVVDKVLDETEEFVSEVKESPSKKRFFKRIRR